MANILETVVFADGETSKYTTGDRYSYSGRP